MSRLPLFLAALFVSAAPVASGCAAAEAQIFRFALEPDEQESRIRVQFRKPGEENHHWSTEFPVSELVGLDLARLRQAGSGPVQFVIIRQAGRLDCEGTGERSAATGTCTFAFDSSFGQLLEQRGIGSPDAQQQIGLMATNAQRELIDALEQARYPAPNVEKLIALSALQVSGEYIAELARAGYRPETLDRLVEFKALGITPQFVSGLAHVGYERVSSRELVELKALEITPAYITGFQKIGYRHLPVAKLVQLKALEITPEFIQAMAQDGEAPSVDQLDAAVLRHKTR